MYPSLPAKAISILIFPVHFFDRVKKIGNAPNVIRDIKYSKMIFRENYFLFLLYYVMK